MERERRTSARLAVVVPVMITSELFGRFVCVARNISASGIFLETQDPLPLGTEIGLRFSWADRQAASRIQAHGVVRNHYYLTYGEAQGARCLTGMGVRFKGFAAGDVTRLTELAH